MVSTWLSLRVLAARQHPYLWPVKAGQVSRRISSTSRGTPPPSIALRSNPFASVWGKCSNCRLVHTAAPVESFPGEKSPQPEREGVVSSSRGERGFVDSFGRQHTYLRISLTERCNLRCFYCMPTDGVPLSPSESLLTAEEIIRLASIFARNGVSKIRLTGGEPLVRKDFGEIAQSLGQISGIKTLAVTTNALVLKRHIPVLQAAGVSALNISLDTLVEPKFELIARRKGHSNVLSGLYAALDAGFPSVKLNVVAMKGVNDDEIVDFCELTKDYPLEVRFIEFMPFTGNRWSDSRFISYADMLTRIGEHFGSLSRCTDDENDTCKHYRISGHLGRVGFITSMSNHFCGSCNRLRITADGNIKVCLFGSEEVSLRDALRQGASDAEIRELISSALAGKHFALGGNRDMYAIAENESNRSMLTIGG